jgi:hypothetical protein
VGSSEEVTGSPVGSLISQYGLPTAILLVAGYAIYSDILKPLAGNYQQLLLEVKLNNTEIRKGILELGEENRKRIAAIEDQILKNSEIIGSGVEKVAEANRAEIARIEEKIDRLLDSQK